MKKFVVIALSALFTVSSLFSQSTKEEELKKNGEIYFKFEIGNMKDISWLTNMISIDDVKKNVVFAFANEKEINELEATGIPYTILPHPNEGFDPVMKDYDEIKNSKAWDAYPTYSAYVAQMYQFEASYPGLCDVFSIGQTVEGRELLVAKISDNVGVDEAEPEFFYTSSIHGDELTGYVLMLRLIDSLLTTYSTSTNIANLVNNIEIYINPLANPDGTYAGGNNSVSSATRYNANGYDLNRNYRDVISGLNPNTQPETFVFMNFAESRHFVMSANFHGGAEVANYPWDRWSHLTADDNWWQYVCHEYADMAQANSPAGYLEDYNDGITNGYAWYSISGGRQDYMNYFQQCRELTLEISGVKLIPAAQLPAHWNYNRKSLLNYLDQCRYGIRGMITDATTGAPIEDAEVYVLNHELDSSWVYSSPAGNYHRLLNAGTYSVRVSAPCYQTQIFNNLTVQNKNATVLNVQLTSDPIDFGANKTTVSNGENVNFTDLSCNNPLTWNWTFTGPGSPTFVLGTTNLSQNPVVQFANAGSYTVSLTTTSSSGSNTETKNNYINVVSCTITSFPWTEGFENAGNIPNCWSQEYVTNTQNWTYQNGGYSGHPAAAHSGSYNAYFYYAGTTARVTRLVSPQLNLAVITNPVLTFWHTQALWSSDQDELRIYYKTSSGGAWTLLQTYTNSITSWIQETINLPNGTNTYYIAFQGTAKYGYGVCLDDITVNGTMISPPVANFIANITEPNIGETVTFTDQSINNPTSWAWNFNPVTVTYVGGTNPNSQNPQVQFDAAGNYTVNLIATNIAGSDSEQKTDYIIVQSPDFYVDIKVMLEGPFNNSGMNTEIAGLIDFPLSQPYSVYPWSYAGTENVTVVPPDAVDWVLIELRDALTAETANEGTRIARQAAFLLSDGSMAGLDGISNPQFSNLIANQLFVVIWHRNHLGVLSAFPLMKTGDIYFYDFTSGVGQAYGIDAQKYLADGIYGLWGGDAYADGVVDDLDKTISWQTDSGTTGYLSSDLNLDGQSDNKDKNQVWLPNKEKGAQMP